MPAVAERLSNERGKENRGTIHAAMMQQQQQM